MASLLRRWDESCVGSWATLTELLELRPFAGGPGWDLGRADAVQSAHSCCMWRDRVVGSRPWLCALCAPASLRQRRCVYAAARTAAACIAAGAAPVWICCLPRSPETAHSLLSSCLPEGCGSEPGLGPMPCDPAPPFPETPGTLSAQTLFSETRTPCLGLQSLSPSSQLTGGAWLGWAASLQTWVCVSAEGTHPQSG